MNSSEVLIDALGRVRDVVKTTVEGLDDAGLTYRAGPGTNTIAWLIWHLTRIQDDHIAGVAGTEQVWIQEAWHERFDLPFHTRDTGFGHDDSAVSAVKVDSGLLIGYHDAVHSRSVDYLSGLSDDDLDRVIDENWDPPVTLGVRLVSVVNDDMQHAGQAALIKGVAIRDSSI